MRAEITTKILFNAKLLECFFSIWSFRGWEKLMLKYRYTVRNNI